MAELALARRNGHCTTGREIPISANFFPFTLKDQGSRIRKYDVSIEPHISESCPKERERVVNRCKAQIIEHLGKFVFANTMLFSAQGSEFKEFQCTLGEVNYVVKVTPVGPVETDREIVSFYNKFFNSIQGKLDFVMIGRKFYNYAKAVDLPQHKLTIWPGYVSSIGTFARGCLINIDISHRCLRTNTIYDQIKELRSKNPPDFRGAVSKLLIGSIVLTLYNKRNYKIDDIEWDMSPSSTFSGTDGNPKDLKSYYSEKWGKAIVNNDQPLLKSKTKRMDVLLVPEFCVMTGLTDEIRSDFNIMKDMANATKKEPGNRLGESAGLISALKSNPKSREEIEKWRADISAEPVNLTGRVLPAGSINLGNKKTFAINEQSGSFDRDIQGVMFTQGPLNSWGIFFCRNDGVLVEKSLLATLEQVTKTYGVKCGKPNLISVDTDRWNDWDAKLRGSLNPNVNAIICVLPGARGKSRLYDDLKRLTFSTLPVPSQVILNATLKKDKGLRSVINKVIMQINAKIGGIPWALNCLPFSDAPTMVVGIDVYHKAGHHSVLGFCATTDIFFAKYVSLPKVNAPGEEVCARLRDCVSQAMTQFKQDNGIFPKRVVVFRDGVSDSQREAVLRGEIPQFTSAFDELKTSGLTEHPGLLFLVVNKRINARFYSNEGGRVNNPPLGTVVDQQVISKEGYDFYIMPAKATQGAMTPTHFHVIYDSVGSRCDEIQQLAYRMCYSYYNWSGSIRVPAPCQYAHKLAYQFGERANNSGPPIPHSHWAETRSLYFL